MGSSLSAGENFIFFLLGSDELSAARIVEKKDIGAGQWPWAILYPQGCEPQDSPGAYKRGDLLRRDEAGDVGSGPPCTTITCAALKK